MSLQVHTRSAESKKARQCTRTRSGFLDLAISACVWLAKRLCNPVGLMVRSPSCFNRLRLSLPYVTRLAHPPHPPHSGLFIAPRKKAQVELCRQRCARVGSADFRRHKGVERRHLCRRMYMRDNSTVERGQVLPTLATECANEEDAYPARQDVAVCRREAPRPEGYRGDPKRNGHAGRKHKTIDGTENKPTPKETTSEPCNGRTDKAAKQP